MYKALSRSAFLFLLLALLSTRIEQFCSAFWPLLSLSTVLLAFSFLVYVPKKVLVRYDRLSFGYGRLAMITLLLLCLDTGALIALLVFTGEPISLGLRIGPAWFLLVTVSGPISEELIFRLGIIGGGSWLAKRRDARWHGGWMLELLLIVISAAVFGIFHVFDVIERTSQHIALITFGGGIYGFAYVKYGLAVSILLHATYNFIALML